MAVERFRGEVAGLSSSAGGGFSGVLTMFVASWFTVLIFLDDDASMILWWVAQGWKTKSRDGHSTFVERWHLTVVVQLTMFDCKEPKLTNL